MYNSYEEYMQSVLGYNTPNNTYRETEGYYYDTLGANSNLQNVNEFYPEIYGIVYPVVQKVCSRVNTYNISKEQINQMVDEVYDVVEPREEVEDTREVLKNGDVKNPRVKETRRPRPNNNTLRDLIRILILRELLQGGRPGFPPRPGPNPGPGHGPGRPPMPGGRPPIFRPRNVLNNIK